MSTQRVLEWVDAVKSAKAKIRKSDPDVDKVPDEVVLAFIKKESEGRMNAALGSREFGFGEPIEVRTVNKKGVEGKYTRSIMGGTQCRVDRFYEAMKNSGSLKYLINPERKKKGGISLGRNNCIAYSKEIFSNKEIQVEAFLRDQLRQKRVHGFKADLMGLNWFNPGSLRKYVSMLPPSEKSKISNFEQITPGSDAAAVAFLAGEQIPMNNSTLSYPTGIYRNTRTFANLLGKEFNTGLFVKDWASRGATETGITPGGATTIDGTKQELFKTMMGETPFEFGSFVLPEEIAKGIVAEIIDVNDWYLNQIGDKEQKFSDESKGKKELPPIVDRFKTAANDVLSKGGALVQKQLSLSTYRGDLATGERQTYIQGIVEAEFYKRKYGARSIPGIGCEFNPYVTPGFPGLIMDPIRPVVGFVDSVSHSINVGAGSGTTSISMSFPRYWDEGEVYYYVGGEPTSDPLLRRFPQWHNSLTVSINHAPNLESLWSLQGDRGRNALDEYYQFLIGCDSIDYVSNHANIAWTREDFEKTVSLRIPGPFKVHPENLEIRDYNSAIAEKDEAGAFKRGTLCHSIYGNKKPARDLRPVIPREDMSQYQERFGIRERQLLEEFLENKYARYRGRLIVMGPTFANPVKNGEYIPTSIQEQICSWMDELDGRSLGGGVR
jgi:hypothetical protein